jgi:hypothetical protein
MMPDHQAAAGSGHGAEEHALDRLLTSQYRGHVELRVPPRGDEEHTKVDILPSRYPSIDPIAISHPRDCQQGED